MLFQYTGFVILHEFVLNFCKTSKHQLKIKIFIELRIVLLNNFVFIFSTRKIQQKNKQKSFLFHPAWFLRRIFIKFIMTNARFYKIADK